ncbi:MAG: ABC transporter ATP-binding protein, partial [Clostridia bacterium]|nr:ABC transporter ATP-binding protein [Clostridia bacterium]
MKFVFKHLRPFSGHMYYGLFIKFLGTITDLLLPYILAHIIDNVTPTKNTKALLWWGVAMLICSIGTFLFNAIANRVSAAVARDTTRSIRGTLFKRIAYLSGSQMDYFTVPSLISRMTTDTHHI